MNLQFHGLNSLAQALAGQLGASLAGGLLILLLARLFSHGLRHGSARARFAVWFTGLVAITGLPFAAFAWSLATAHGSVSASGKAAAITLPAAWALYFFLAWSVVAAIALGRIVVGFWQVLVLRRHSATLDSKDLSPELQGILARFQPVRSVALLLSEEVHSPTAVGLLSPAIILPRWLLRDLSTDELRQILLHELEHLRRRDDWSNLGQKIVQALFFFHPAVWWMERQVSLEREMACDEAVLAHTGNPRAYAECLVRLAERSFIRRSVLLAQAAVSRVGQTSRRVARILSEGSEGRAGLRKSLIVPCFAAALLACVALLARAPQLIAFQSNPVEVRLANVRIASSRMPAVVPASSVSPVFSQPSAKLSKIYAAHKQPATVATRPHSAMPVRGNQFAAPVVNANLKVNSPDAPVSQWIVVFMETRWNGSTSASFWQVQMWRVTLLQMPKNPAPKPAPQKVI